MINFKGNETDFAVSMSLFTVIVSLRSPLVHVLGLQMN